MNHPPLSLCEPTQLDGKGVKNSHYHLEVLLKITCVRGRARQRQKGREKVKTLCLNSPHYLQQTRLDRCYTDTPETCYIKCAKKIGDWNPKPDFELNKSVKAKAVSERTIQIHTILLIWFMFNESRSFDVKSSHQLSLLRFLQNWLFQSSFTTDLEENSVIVSSKMSMSFFFQSKRN